MAGSLHQRTIEGKGGRVHCSCGEVQLVQLHGAKWLFQHANAAVAVSPWSGSLIGKLCRVFWLLMHPAHQLILVRKEGR